MACCNAVFERCAPDGTPVIGILDAETETTTYRNLDGTPYAGDATLLVSCESGSTSSLTTVENADGTTTVTHNPGNGSEPSSFTYGGATVTDNGDGTADIDDGTTTATVDLTKPVKCDGTDRAAGEVLRFQTIDEEVTDLKADAYLWVDSGDGCTPADRTGCLDKGGVSHGPYGYVWEYAPGSATATKVSGPNYQDVGCGLKVGATTWNLGSSGDPEAAALTVPPNWLLNGAATGSTFDIPNPTCDPIKAKVVVRLHGDTLSQIGVNVALNGGISLNGGASFRPVHLIWGLHTNDKVRNDALQSRSECVTIPPGGLTVEYQLGVAWQLQDAAATANTGTRMDQPAIYWDWIVV